MNSLISKIHFYSPLRNISYVEMLPEGMAYVRMLPEGILPSFYTSTTSTSNTPSNSVTMSITPVSNYVYFDGKEWKECTFGGYISGFDLNWGCDYSSVRAQFGPNPSTTDINNFVATKAVSSETHLLEKMLHFLVENNRIKEYSSIESSLDDLSKSFAISNAHRILTGGKSMAHGVLSKYSPPIVPTGEKETRLMGKLWGMPVYTFDTKEFENDCFLIGVSHTIKFYIQNDWTRVDDPARRMLGCYFAGLLSVNPITISYIPFLSKENEEMKIRREKSTMLRIRRGVRERRILDGTRLSC